MINKNKYLILALITALVFSAKASAFRHILVVKTSTGQLEVPVDIFDEQEGRVQESSLPECLAHQHQGACSCILPVPEWFQTHDQSRNNHPDVWLKRESLPWFVNILCQFSALFSSGHNNILSTGNTNTSPDTTGIEEVQMPKLHTFNNYFSFMEETLSATSSIFETFITIVQSCLYSTSYQPWQLTISLPKVDNKREVLSNQNVTYMQNALRNPQLNQLQPYFIQF